MDAEMLGFPQCVIGTVDVVWMGASERGNDGPLNLAGDARNGFEITR